MSASDPKNRANLTTVAPIVEDAPVAQGDLLNIVTAADATAANRGKLTRATNDINRLAVGWNREGARTGNDTGTIAATAERDLGNIQRELAVTGVTGQLDVGSAVYATAHGTYTLTRAARSIPIGHVAAFVSTGRAMVALWDAPALAQYAVLRETVNLGLIVLAGTDTTKVLLKYPVPYRCKLTSVSAYYATAAAGASATAALTFRRDPLAAGSGHVAVTGGQIDLATGTGNAEGNVVAGSAITATNNFYEGDLLEGSLVISDAGTFTGGTLLVRGVLDRVPGN